MFPTDELVKGMLTDAVAVGKTLDPAAVFVGLYIMGPTVNPPVLSTDFTLPDATDAPAKAVTAWTAPFKLLDERWAIQGNLLTWRLPDADNAFTAAGFYLSDALVAGNVLAWEPISPNINLPDAFHEMSIVPRLTLDKMGTWGANIIIDD